MSSPLPHDLGALLGSTAGLAIVLTLGVALLLLSAHAPVTAPVQLTADWMSIIYMITFITRSMSSVEDPLLISRSCTLPCSIVSGARQRIARAHNPHPRTVQRGQDCAVAAGASSTHCFICCVLCTDVRAQSLFGVADQLQASVCMQCQHGTCK